MAAPRKLVLAPGAIIRDNTVHTSYDKFETFYLPILKLIAPCNGLTAEADLDTPTKPYPLNHVLTGTDGAHGGTNQLYL